MNKVYILRTDEICNTRSRSTPVGIYSSIKDAYAALDKEKREVSKSSWPCLEWEIVEAKLGTRVSKWKTIKSGRYSTKKG